MIYMEDFLSISNFTYLIKDLNFYSKSKYDELLEYNKYKTIIGTVMEEVYKEYKNKINKKKANEMVIYTVKTIIDTEMKEQFFENENISQLNNLKELKPVVDENINYNKEDLTIRNVYEKRFDKVLEKNKEINRQINNDTIIKKEYNQDLQNFFIMEEKPEDPIDLEKNPQQYREDLIIKPDEFIKSLNKHILYYDLIIDSRDRNIDTHPNPNDYDLDLEKHFHNIISLELISAEIPNTEYIINNDNNLLHFEETGGTTIIATIPIGNYTLSTLSNQIQTQMNSVGSSTYTVVSTTTNRISITSDLTGGSGIFNLDFFGGQRRTGHSGHPENKFKEGSIGEIIGFNPEQLTGSNNYVSSNKIVLDGDRQVFLSIEGIDNVNTIETPETNKFVLLTLTSNKGEITYIKNNKNNPDWEHPLDNEFVFFSHTPINLRKLKIKFYKINNKLYNFNGIEHSLHFRIKRFNFKNQVIDSNKLFKK